MRPADVAGYVCLGIGIAGAFTDGLGVPAYAWAAGYAGLALMTLVVTHQGATPAKFPSETK